MCSASHHGSAMSVMSAHGSRHLFAPRRLTLKDQSRQPPLRFRPDFVGFLHPDTDPAVDATDHPWSGAACSASCLTSPGSAPGLSRHLRRTLRRQCHRGKKAFFNYRATLRVACRSGRSASSLWRSASHSGSARSVMFVYGSRHLFAPRRVTLKDQSNQNPGSVSVTYVALCVVSAIAIKKRFYVQ